MTLTATSAATRGSLNSSATNSVAPVTGMDSPHPDDPSDWGAAEREYVRRLQALVSLADGYAGAESRGAALFAAVWGRRVYRALRALDYAESRLGSCPRPVAIGGHNYVTFRCPESDVIRVVGFAPEEEMIDGEGRSDALGG